VIHCDHWLMTDMGLEVMVLVTRESILQKCDNSVIDVHVFIA
jgi:hypothetical protein